MVTQAQITTQLGRVILFCGTETIDYMLGDWSNVINFARSHGIDSLLVKCADGGGWWYGGLDIIKLMRNECIANGLGFIPYTYSYGDKFQAFNLEMNIADLLMATFQVVCIDMEQEYNARTDLATKIQERFGARKGLLLCSTWADPQLQNWDGNLKILKNTFDAFMPQEYTNYLDSTEVQLSQDGIVNMIPTVYMGSDLSQNNVMSIAAHIHQRGHSSISLWYDGFAINNPGLVDQIVNLFKSQVPPPRTPPVKGTNYMSVQFDDVWKNSVKNTSSTSGIHNFLKSAIESGSCASCFALTPEYTTVDRDGKTVIRQDFSNGFHVNWYEGKGTLYDFYNKVVVAQ